MDVHVSFLMIDHVQNHGVFLIAANIYIYEYIYTYVCALVTYILFPQKIVEANALINGEMPVAFSGGKCSYKSHFGHRLEVKI